MSVDRVGADRVRQLLADSAGQEIPRAGHCLDLARAYADLADPAAAVRWAFVACDTSEEVVDWMAASAVIRRCLPLLPPLPRQARVAVLGSYTTTQLAALLPAAAARTGVAIEVYEGGYGQYRQEILDPGSGLYAFAPDVVILAVHAGELDLPPMSQDPGAEVERELARWTSLWDVVRGRSGARVVQHTFALPPEEPLGHLAGRVAGSGYAMRQRLNSRLAEAAGAQVALLDCERLASTVGKKAWFDARYWLWAKQAVSLSFVPLLARHTAAVIAAGLGQSKKCLVLDLDNTLWGGVIGEEGLGGIQLGDGPVGEAYAAFQDYVLALKSRGVVLAVASKNDPDAAREVFEKHPDMRIRLDDVAVFSAGWDDKATQLRRIAATLGLGLDSLVFVDDNPAEREVIRQLLPEVDVVPLPSSPAGYVRALADYLLFEPATLTDEDASRTELYRARARTSELAESTGSLEDFLRSLDMVAAVSELDEVTVPRVAQLIGKTNQFNLTGRRRGLDEVSALTTDPRCEVLCLRLRDRFADHGLVGVLIGFAGTDGTFSIDTWLMSCRVIGRTLEHEMLALIARRAGALGCTRLAGEYRPSAKNALVADLYPRLGFSPQEPSDADHGMPSPVTRWSLPVNRVPSTPGFIQISG